MLSIEQRKRNANAAMIRSFTPRGLEQLAEDMIAAEVPVEEARVKLLDALNARELLNNPEQLLQAVCGR